MIVVTAKDLDEGERRTLSGKVAQVVRKDSYSAQEVLVRLRELLTYT